MMTSAQIRQSFLDFFRSKQHTIVPSSSLMPDSPNLLFTNAGMNQFVPIFLGERKADVSKWAGAIPSLDTRAADTQKCIRAGGKHNDLDDVGLDTYHHTFFEMLGNWSFGDYFKKEAIDWAWELVIEVWKFPAQRVYATIYQPNKAKNDPADRDQEAWELWAAKFRSVGLDPDIHIVNGGKKDNFWMMGETGPCGPCTEIHVDLRPGPRETSVEEQKVGATLVNGSDARCIEIWNNVFIQYNAEPATPEDAVKMTQPGAKAGETWKQNFVPLPAKHVDTGMGFERVTSIIQGTKGLTDFQNAKISNYETDIFRPIFDEIEKLSGKKYGSTLPKAGSTGDTAQEKEDVAFRVIADHIRTLSFAIADGIEPGTKERNGVLRSIHKRMLRYASAIGVEGEVLLRTQDRLIETLAIMMGDVFPEIRAKKEHIKEVLRREADVFNRTLDNGLEIFSRVAVLLTEVQRLVSEIEPEYRAASLFLETAGVTQSSSHEDMRPLYERLQSAHSRLFTFKEVELWRDVGSVDQLRLLEVAWPLAGTAECLLTPSHYSASEFYQMKADVLDRLSKAGDAVSAVRAASNVFPGRAAFLLYDTYGFPLDLTELMARERGLSVDVAGFKVLMEEQKKRSQAAQKKQVIELSQIETKSPTHFLGYDSQETSTQVLEVVEVKDKTAVILDASVCYAEMGGQVGDTGALSRSGQLWRIVNTQKSGNTVLHFIEGGDAPAIGSHVTVQLDSARRAAIQRHHTVTHLLHWALHEVASKEASQKGSSVTPEKLTFDFNSAALTPAQVSDIEKLVNERILENAGVSWTEVPHADVKNRKDVMQFFGDKYGDVVRVVQIGGKANALDGYSMELCGGTHTRATGEIGLFRIVSEAAVSAGVRRIEAVAGLSAYDVAKRDVELIRSVAGRIGAPVAELEKKLEALLAQQKELERQLKTAVARNASNAASELLSRVQTVNDIPLIAHNLGDTDADFLQAVADALKGRFQGVIVLGGGSESAVALIAAVTPQFTAKAQAGKIIQAIAPIVGGKGGGKPDNARGGGKDVTKLDEALAKVRTLLG
jgi:alanyl-tRNA synthetase